MVPMMPTCIAVSWPILVACTWMPRKVQFFEQPRDIGQVAAQAVECFAQHDVEPAGAGIHLQAAQPRPEGAGATDRRVTVFLDDVPSHARGIAAANFDLILDGGFALILRTVAGVDDGALSHSQTPGNWGSDQPQRFDRGRGQANSWSVMRHSSDAAGRALYLARPAPEIMITFPVHLH
jgi:hypothetical protein